MLFIALQYAFIKESLLASSTKTSKNPGVLDQSCGESYPKNSAKR
jgi:hypothetical protein